MSQWFFAANGQQQGPYPEDQFRNLIASGAVRADTLVWTEGMAGWQRAADVPGLMASAGRPPSLPQAGAPPMMAGGGSGGSLSIDFEIWEFTWRSLALLLGIVFIIPAPWAIVWYMQWIVTCIHVPGRPNLSFTGTALTIAPWFFGAVVLSICLGLTGVQWLDNLSGIVQIVFYWLFLRWSVANLASNGQPLGLSFSGSFWAYLGWSILTIVSVFTIVGWAWVYTAWVRWFFRNIEGTRREVIFNGTGLEFLWRSIVTLIACLFIIPIPWMYLWMSRWLASQTVLAQRGQRAGA